METPPVLTNWWGFQCRLFRFPSGPYSSMETERGVKEMSLPQGALDQMLAVLVAGLLEGVGVPWPGVVVVAGAGLAAGGDRAGLWLLAVVCATGYTLGALLQYAVGRLVGQGALKWLPVKLQVKLEGLVERHGAGVVFWTRPFAVGNYVSIPAGMARMPLRRFLPATFLGICPWAFGLMWFGGLLGEWLGSFQAAVSAYLAPGALVLAVGAGAVMGWQRLRRRPSQA